ncbi:MAG: hypothetical protein K0S68_535 [Candidatus Saccharibacteria bacterium]|jgi:hypothetical protein|nr:hypothetical protein [Candidatus Saccharibacteria bacterium]
MKQVLKRYGIVLGAVLASGLLAFGLFSTPLYFGARTAPMPTVPSLGGWFNIILYATVFVGLKYLVYEAVAAVISGRNRSQLRQRIFYAGFGLALFIDCLMTALSLRPVSDSGYAVLGILIGSPVALVLALGALVWLRVRDGDAVPTLALGEEPATAPPADPPASNPPTPPAA